MDDPRVAELLQEFKRWRYFDNEPEARRAAIQLVQLMDRMAAKNETSVVDPKRPGTDVGTTSPTPAVSVEPKRRFLV